MIYSAFLDTGAPLPSFIKFNSGSMGFSIFSNNPKEKGGYNIVVKGTTKFYNASASIIQTTFHLNVRCFTLGIKPKV